MNIKGVFQLWLTDGSLPRGAAQRGARVDARGLHAVPGLRRRARRPLDGRHRRVQRLDARRRAHGPGPRPARRDGRATARSRCGPATTTPARSRCSASSPASAGGAGPRRPSPRPGGSPRRRADARCRPSRRRHAPCAVVLVRHGATATTGKVLPGPRPGPAPLRRAGARQAEAVAERIAALRARARSPSTPRPLERAQETAAPIARALAPAGADRAGPRRVRLRRLDRARGSRRCGGGASGARCSSRRRTFRFPRGESFTELQARAWDAVLALGARHPGETIVAVSHADPIKAIVAAALGVPLDLFQRTVVSTCSVSVVVVGAGAPLVLCVNSLGDLQRAGGVVIHRLEHPDRVTVGHDRRGRPAALPGPGARGPAPRRRQGREGPGRDPRVVARARRARRCRAPPPSRSTSSSSPSTRSTSWRARSPSRSTRLTRPSRSRSSPPRRTATRSS